MKFKTKELKGVTVIALAGNILGGPDATALNTHLHSLLTEQRVHIVIDLKAVDFINSSGLSILIGGLTAVRKTGGDLKLARASSKIENLLKMTKLLNVFELHKTVQNAVEAFSA
jgi:anti-sigma B factor antagonist